MYIHRHVVFVLTLESSYKCLHYATYMYAIEGFIKQAIAEIVDKQEKTLGLVRDLDPGPLAP